MKLKEKLEKIDLEIESGLKYKSTDRLRNLIQENPNDIHLRNKLAELYFDSGFLDSAGMHWILTEPTHERIKKSLDIYEKSVNYSGCQILQDITFRGDKSKLSEFAQNKLTQLESDSKEKTNHIPTFKPRINKPKNLNQSQNNYQTSRNKFEGYILFAIVASIIILILIGFVTVLNWIF